MLTNAIEGVSIILSSINLTVLDDVEKCKEYGIDYKKSTTVFCNKAEEIKEIAEFCISEEINYKKGGTLYK